MGLAPDGKIYVSSASGSNRLLSRIESPNLQGVDCNVNQHGIALPTSYIRTMPNFPNYRLGPLDGSPCDTLNIDNVPVAKFRCEQDTGNVLNYEFVDLSYFEPEIWAYSINGETVNEQNFSYEFPTSGEYEICLEVSNENGMDSYCKTIVIGLINSVAEEEIDYSSRINIYPNPFKDILTMSFHDYFPVESYYKCYTVAGQLVSEGLLKSNWNTVDLGRLAKGKYFIVFYESGKVIGSKSIVKLE
jgi:PKD repeat protein